MVRKVFFSFQYERDIWRVYQVRNHWVTKLNRPDAGYIDKAEFEKLKRRGDTAIRSWIDSQLEGTSVTVVLIGAETSGRKWVDYEIEKSYMKNNGQLGIYIHNLKDSNGYSDYKGANPFDRYQVQVDGRDTLLSEIYSTYDWVLDNGYANFAKWVEKAAADAGR